MANDTVPMTIMFKACRDVIFNWMEPMHYHRLTLLALKKLGYTKDDIDWFRQIEDVREKLLEANRLGFGYIGKPYCLAYLKEWVNSSIQYQLFNPENPPCFYLLSEGVLKGMTEIQMRQFIPKNDMASKETRAKVKAKGLFVEHQISSLFSEHWANYYLPPDNEGKYDLPCNHDFKLLIGKKILRVDVAGPNSKGLFGPGCSGKKPTDIHIIAAQGGKDHIIIYGYKYGYEFKGEFTQWDTHPISRLIFRLNCQKLGIDYNFFNFKFREKESEYGRDHIINVAANQRDRSPGRESDTCGAGRGNDQRICL